MIRVTEAAELRNRVMSRRSGVSLFALALLVAALAIPATAEACSCAGPANGESVGEFYAEGIRNSDAAVIAAVIEMRIVDPQPEYGGDERAIYTLRIRRSFKRLERYPEGEKIRVHSSLDGASCGVGLEEGDVAGLLLFRSRGRLQATSCGRASPRNLRRGARRLSDRSSRSRPRRAPCPVARAPRPA